jgi:hypothetical protein
VNFRSINNDNVSFATNKTSVCSFLLLLGGGSLFDGSILAGEGDIIVITMNFRLNYHGFLSSGDHRMKGIRRFLLC